MRLKKARKKISKARRNLIRTDVEEGIKESSRRNLFNHLVKLGNNNPKLQEDISPVLHHLQRSSDRVAGYDDEEERRKVQEEVKEEMDDALSRIHTALHRKRKGKLHDLAGGDAVEDMRELHRAVVKLWKITASLNNKTKDVKELAERHIRYNLKETDLNVLSSYLRDALDREDFI